MKGTEEGIKVNVEFVENSPTKTLVITGEGRQDKTGTYGQIAVVPVQIDEKNKTWHLSNKSSANLQKIYGKESKEWIGKPIKLEVLVNDKGKKYIEGTPLKSLDEA